MALGEIVRDLLEGKTPQLDRRTFIKAGAELVGVAGVVALTTACDTQSPKKPEEQPLDPQTAFNAIGSVPGCIRTPLSLQEVKDSKNTPGPDEKYVYFNRGRRDAMIVTLYSKERNFRTIVVQPDTATLIFANEIPMGAYGCTGNDQAAQLKAYQYISERLQNAQ